MEPWHSVDVEAAIHEAELEHLEVGTLFDQLANADTRGLLIAGERRRVLTMNVAARTVLGYRGPLPRPAGEVAAGTDLQFAIGDAFHDRRPVVVESYVPNPDRLLRFHVVPILAPDGTPFLVVVTIDDVTRLRLLETVRRDFVANVSHELRTPIASINLLVETLQRGALRDEEAAQHFLHRIEIETQAMAHLVEELLELSRLETGALALDLAPLDVESLLRSVVARLAPTAEEKGIEVQIDVRGDLPDVDGDRKRLEQVLMNLVHNAIKFTPSGGKVSVRAARQALGVGVEVIDTGVGLDPSEAARVFERFYKVDKGRNRGAGAGLGLAIAKHLLDLHGSSLQVVSEAGRGSRFWFLLPLHTSGAAER